MRREVEDPLPVRLGQSDIHLAVITPSCSVMARAIISPDGATIADPPIMCAPSSTPLFAAAATHTEFW